MLSNKEWFGAACSAEAELAGLENSDWWCADLQVPQELFDMEFVFLDSSASTADNNKCGTTI